MKNSSRATFLPHLSSALCFCVNTDRLASVIRSSLMSESSQCNRDALGFVHLLAIIRPQCISLKAENPFCLQQILQRGECRPWGFRRDILYSVHAATPDNMDNSKYGLVEQIHTPCDHWNDAVACDYFLFHQSKLSIRVIDGCLKPDQMIWGKGALGLQHPLWSRQKTQGGEYTYCSIHVVDGPAGCIVNNHAGCSAQVLHFMFSTFTRNAGTELFLF